MVMDDAWHWRRVGGVAAAGAVLVAVSAGCTGSDPAPSPSTTVSSNATKTTPPTSSSPSTTASATSTAANGIPAAAKAHTPAGAEAFVRYYLTQIDRAWREADPSLLPPLCKTESKDCATSQQTAVELAAKQQHYSGETARWTSIKALNTAGHIVTVRAVGKALRVNIVDASGHVVSTDPALDLRLEYEAEWIAGRWQIRAGFKEA